MSRPVAFFVGSATAPNIQRLVSNIGWMLSSTIDLHLVTTAPESFTPEVRSHFDIFGGEYPNSSRGEYQAVESYLQNHTPSAIVQLTYPPVHGSIVGVAANRNDVPFIYRYNGDRFQEYAVARGRDRVVAFAIGNVLGRLPLRLSDHNIALGPAGRTRLCDYGVDPDSITVLPPSIDVGSFRIDTADPVYSSIPDNRRIVLFVGRLSHLKGVKTLERSIPAVIDNRDDVHFVLVGDQEVSVPVPSNYRDRVTIEGRVSPEAMSSYYARADLLVHPSLTEGIPRVLLESLAARTPVLARDVGDVASVTKNTFTTESEFINGISSLESLEVDDIGPFSRETLRPRYREFFEGISLW